MELNLSPLDIWFDPAIETYRINGQPGVRVSHVLDLWPKDFLAPWACKMMEEYVLEHSSDPRLGSRNGLAEILKEGKSAHKDKSRSALDIGSEAHKWIEKFIILGKPVDMPTNPKVVSCINAFLAWERQNKIEWVSSELLVGHADYMFGGRLDALAYINGKFCLVDFKTSARIYESYKNQVAAYQCALEHMQCQPIDERWILRFPKDEAGFEAKKLESKYEDDRDDFLAALQFYKRLNRRAA